MKLKELRPYLKTERVNLYIEPKKPISYELYGMDDETGKLAEYSICDYLEKYDEFRKYRKVEMFKKYGEYKIEAIYVSKDTEILNIDLEYPGNSRLV